MYWKSYWYALRGGGWNRIATRFLAVYGFFWLAIESLAFFFPNILNFKAASFAIIFVFSLAISVISRFPRLRFTSRLSSPDTKIEIKVGDLFEQKGHLVIGFNDFFDVASRSVNPASVQHQFLTNYYDGDANRLDEEIAEDLKRLEHIEYLEEKIDGKKERYPIGTVVVVPNEPFVSQYFLAAYARLDVELYSSSNPEIIWVTLNELWMQIRKKAMAQQVSMPVIGSDLARTGLPRMALIMMIIISFVTASKRELVTKRLTIMIHPKDLEHVNLIELQEFLDAACF